MSLPTRLLGNTVSSNHVELRGRSKTAHVTFQATWHAWVFQDIALTIALTIELTYALPYRRAVRLADLQQQYALTPGVISHLTSQVTVFTAANQERTWPLWLLE